MLAKFFASWLVVLVIVPFTAPFSTCDLAGFVRGAQGAHRRAHAIVWRRSSSSIDSLSGQQSPFAPPTSAAVTHDAAIPSVPCISTARRVRVMALSGLPLTRTKIFSSAHFINSGAQAGCVRDHTSLTTILRL
jgi:hypothetical protein